MILAQTSHRLLPSVTPQGDHPEAAISVLPEVPRVLPSTAAAAPENLLRILLIAAVNRPRLQQDQPGHPRRKFDSLHQ